MRNFFEIVKLEMLRVFRNKFVVIMLFIFPILLMCLVAFIQKAPAGGGGGMAAVVYCNGTTTESQQFLDEMFNGVDANRVQYVESHEEGLDKIRHAETVIFISIDATSEPAKAQVYFDESTPTGQAIMHAFAFQANEYAYQTLVEYLAESGITLNRDYFEPISFEKVSPEGSSQQLMFWIEAAICLFVIICFGITYSTSRDSETRVQENLKYMPYNKHKYIWAKVLPYVLLGFIEFLIMLLIGFWGFDIRYQGSFYLIVLSGFAFVLSVVFWAFLCSMLKTQVATIFADMVVMILPIFVLLFGSIQSFNIIFQIILYCFPITGFIPEISGLTYYGVFAWENVAILLAQAVATYWISWLVLKRRAG